MTLTAPQLSKEDLVARRKEVRKQQLYQQLKNLWRYSLLIILVGLSFWLGRESLWELRHPEHIVVIGGHVLPPEHLRGLMALALPLRIYEVEPDHLARVLYREPVVEAVQVRRRLWPPTLEVTVQERTPVALVLDGAEPGVLDRNGVWMSLKRYPRLPRPQLTVVGYTPRDQQRWQALYPLFSQSPVAIRKINLTQPNNIRVLTDLGLVHLGHPDPEFLKAQLTALDRLRNLPTRIPPSQIAFIDLTSPTAVQLRQLPPLPAVKTVISAQ
ncbi:cell division protein FtsQ/DivIB [Anthocerotibacter panamensis]|uniref:cell division protein FtsQ/DivIB n=1 Tax=Anthocerotibacter panamensis TaxID=2857077 RepID=UPI001C4088CF|nr:FtsQ-type POTRA domain-containing protein [Anthocerotibacter panamensis]